MKAFVAAVFQDILKVLYPLFSRWLKKEDTVIIAGHGAKFMTGNNYYFFHYLEARSPAFRYFFYTKNKKVFRELSKKFPGRIIYAYRWQTFVQFVKARVLLVSTGYDDFFPFFLPADKKIINLWHGIPIKKIGLDTAGVNNREIRAFSKAIDYFCVSSEFEGELMKQAFELPSRKIFVSGQPKNDFIRHDFSALAKAYPFLNKKVILYAPTFRDEGMEKKSLTELLKPEKLQRLLKKEDAFFLYRSHINATEKGSLQGFNRIVPASPFEFPDAQPLLWYADLLITDYSGIYFDFLLLDRPIIFYNYDETEYRKKRAFLYDYAENTPGPKVQTPEALHGAVTFCLQHPQQDAAARKKVKNKFHTFTDGKACDRIYRKITELM